MPAALHVLSRISHKVISWPHQHRTFAQVVRKELAHTPVALRFPEEEGVSDQAPRYHAMSAKYHVPLPLGASHQLLEEVSLPPEMNGETED